MHQPSDNLVFHLGALGDWVLTYPLLRSLSGSTAAITHWSKAQLAAKMIDGVQPVDIEMREFSRLFADGGPAAMGPATEQMLADANTVISFISNGEDPWAQNIRRLCPSARLAFVTPRPPDDFDDHITRWHATQLEAQGFDRVISDTPIADTRDGPVVIHPGSGGKHKTWPIERFAAVAKTLRAAGRRVDLIAGEAEVDLWPDMKGCRVVPDLMQLYDTLAAASLYIGNDSGPTHLAAALGVSTIALFGPTSPTVWSPVGPRVRIIAPPKPAAMDWLDVETVVKTASAMP